MTASNIVRTLAVAALAMIAIIWFAWPGQAGGADGWIAQMEMDEGGEVMTASVEGQLAPGADFPPAIRMTCFGGVSLRYDVGPLPEGLAPVPGDEPDFVWKTDKGEITLHMLYEDMDGAFAAYPAPTDPIIALLKAGSTLEIAPVTGGYPAVAFTLNGSGKAIDTVLSACTG